MKSAFLSSLSSLPKYRRNWVKPVLLMLLRPVAFSVMLYQPPAGILLKAPTFAAEAAALKSVNARAELVPNQPVRMSTHKFPRMLKGLLPVGGPLCLILMTADWMVAVSGRLAVLKERMDLYWRSAVPSPSWKVVAVALSEPPLLLVSVDSRISHPVQQRTCRSLCIWRCSSDRSCWQ